jgi:hypothetical protein
MTNWVLEVLRSRIEPPVPFAGSVSLFSAVGFAPDNLQYWDIQTSLDNVSFSSARNYRHLIQVSSCLRRVRSSVPQSTSQGSLTNDHIAGEAYAVNFFQTNEPLTPGQCTEAFYWTPQYMAIGSMLNYTMDASKGSLFVFGNTTDMAYQFQLEFNGFRTLS